MLLSDDELLKLKINMSKLKPIIVAKLREKAATYEACMEVAQKLAWLAYGVAGCPPPPDSIRQFLESLFGPIISGSTNCLVCKAPIDYADFAKAQRGKALIETSHSNPRLHTTDNIGFAHRECNIAQGNKTVDEFYGWIAEILRRTGRTVS
jgi:coenzyme F420-reducing hydrogenase gamma subunit